MESLIYEYSTLKGAPQISIFYNTNTLILLLPRLYATPSPRLYKPMALYMGHVLFTV